MVIWWGEGVEVGSLRGGGGGVRREWGRGGGGVEGSDKTHWIHEVH